VSSTNSRRHIDWRGLSLFLFATFLTLAIIAVSFEVNVENPKLEIFGKK